MVSKNTLSLANCKDMNEYFELCWKLAVLGDNKQFELRIQDMQVDDIAVFIQVLNSKHKDAGIPESVTIESAIWLLCEELRTR